MALAYNIKTPKRRLEGTVVPQGVSFTFGVNHTYWYWRKGDHIVSFRTPWKWLSFAERVLK
jgi:hypothetical protein